MTEAAELYAALREFLAGEIMPQLTGQRQFHLRVAINVLGTLEREAALGAAAADRERDRLAALLGREGGRDALNEALAAAIRAGAFDADEPRRAVLAHLDATIADRLAIDHPGYAGGERG